jgi:hypothetical protein
MPLAEGQLPHDRLPIKTGTAIGAARAVNTDRPAAAGADKALHPSFLQGGGVAGSVRIQICCHRHREGGGGGGVFFQLCE